MANSPVDKGDAFIKSGMTLISDPAADRLLIKYRRNKTQTPPNDRLSRPCGGVGGFDDYVERFGE
jgi:hypothetical protein